MAFKQGGGEKLSFPGRFFWGRGACLCLRSLETQGVVEVWQAGWSFSGSGSVALARAVLYGSWPMVLVPGRLLPKVR